MSVSLNPIVQRCIAVLRIAGKHFDVSELRYPDDADGKIPLDGVRHDSDHTHSPESQSAEESFRESSGCLSPLLLAPFIT